MRFSTISGIFRWVISFALFCYLVFIRFQLKARIYQTIIDLKGMHSSSKKITQVKSKSQIEKLLTSIKLNLSSCEKLWNWYLGHSSSCWLKPFFNLKPIQLKSHQTSRILRTFNQTIKKRINFHKHLKLAFIKSWKTMRFYVL